MGTTTTGRIRVKGGSLDARGPWGESQAEEVGRVPVSLAVHLSFETDYSQFVIHSPYTRTIVTEFDFP